jgi:hypothetical protein
MQSHKHFRIGKQVKGVHCGSFAAVIGVRPIRGLLNTSGGKCFANIDMWGVVTDRCTSFLTEGKALAYGGRVPVCGHDGGLRSAL